MVLTPSSAAWYCGNPANMFYNQVPNNYGISNTQPTEEKQQTPTPKKNKKRKPNK